MSYVKTVEMENDHLSSDDEFGPVYSKFPSPNIESSDVESNVAGPTQESPGSSSVWKKYLNLNEEPSEINCTFCGDKLVINIEGVPECPYCGINPETAEELSVSEHIAVHTPNFKLLVVSETEIELLEQPKNPEPEQLEEKFCDTPDHVESPQTSAQEPKLGPLPWKIKDEKVRPYKCTICNKSYTLASGLALHDKRKHLPIKPFVCNICSFDFAQSSDFNKHKKTHTGEKSYNCEECGESFRLKRDLIYHQNIHYNSKHKCSYCDLGFQDDMSLLQHVKSHEGEETHICAICSIPYVNQKDLDLHIKRVHEVAPPNNLVCRVCDKTFNYLIELEEHKISHEEEKQYSCDTCGKCFAHRTSLINHRVVHTGKKPYQCSYCGQAFGYAGNFKAHIRTHTGERPFVCAICDKAFTRSANLKEHLKTHTGERSISCDICGNTFTSSSSYSKHKKIHTGERPHKCNICNKTFVQLVHLNKHTLTHTGEKPYQCEVCLKFYKRKDTLTKHIRIHGIKQSETASNEEQDLIDLDAIIDFIDAVPE